ncbi:sugar phosphate isomerase/epimerase family protein [Mongoliitalea daihaiensis]|uniref:sugar phosphate isomerase/epimerase family protein n=1 Tax=Mongoliitalea daihaiensis TaxID=2782006 RepID=UPI001F26460B|nr:sugar phosphate isomerase/epimerase [Mongoliitalea daihaiensis]
MDKFNSIILVLAMVSTQVLMACGAEKSTNEEVIEDSSSSQGGVALYTLREAMGQDPKATLQRVADQGYAYIEAAGYADGKFYGMEPEEFKAFVTSIGLMPKSTHMGGVTLENADEQIEDARNAGFTYFVIPVPPMGMFTYGPEGLGMKGSAEELVQILNTIGEKCSAAGLKLLYHNHDFEFVPREDGVILTDYILDNTDPAHVNFEIDLYWTVKAGADPLAYFDKYPGRFLVWHLKDMDEEGRFAPVGSGTIDFASILQQRAKAGMVHYFVEQDQMFDGMDPFESIQLSYQNISELGFN